VCFRLCNSKYQSNPTGYFEKPQRNNRRQCGRKDMFLSLPYKVFFKACKSFHEPQRNKRRQSSRKCYIFCLYHTKCLSKPADHFTNHKETTEDKVAGKGVFSSLPSKVSFKACKPFYEPQRNNGGQSSRKGTFSSLPYKASFKAHRSFFEPQRKNGRQCSRKGYVFIFTIQGILQSPPVILRTTKKEKKAK